MRPAPTPVRRLAYAKLNLTLAVTGRRPDGYHTLRSVFLRIGLSDVLEVTEHQGPGDRLRVEGDPSCPIEGNLVLRSLAAVRALEALVPIDDRPLPWLGVRLTKRIPIGAGMGGGSSDAALAADLLHPELRSLATAADPGLLVRLGADVPFFASGHPAALVGGVGGDLEAVPGIRGGVGLLLLVPPSGLPTRGVFAAFDKLGPPGVEALLATEVLAADLRRGMTGQDLADRAAALRTANDLWSAAASVRPELAGLRASLEAALGRPVLLTGSGSGMFAVYPSRGGASVAAARLSGATPGWRGLRVAVVDEASMEADWRVL